MECKRSKIGTRVQDDLVLGCKRGKVDYDALVLRLPAHLLSDILLRLPIESISCCKCVCRTLEKILRDPHFAELHFTNASEADKRLIILNIRSASPLFLFEVLDLDNFPDVNPRSSNHHECAPRLWKKVVIPRIVSEFDRVIVSACNGLLCLEYFAENQYMCYICNPIFGEFKLLPDPKVGISSTVLGFSPKTKHYKVVRFSSREGKKGKWITYRFYGEIHTLGTDCWRPINAPPPLGETSDSYLNGNLHWAAYGFKLSIVLWAFNIETEQGFFIPPPPEFSERQSGRGLYNFNVGVVGGLLCVSYLNDRVYEVFVMKNYGVKDSWTKQFAIDINFISSLQARSGEVSWVQCMDMKKLKQVKVLKDGNLLLGYQDFPLVYYNPRKGCFWKLMQWDDKGSDAHSFVITYDGCYFVPSLISLKEIAKSGNMQVVSHKSCASPQQS